MESCLQWKKLQRTPKPTRSPPKAWNAKTRANVSKHHRTKKHFQDALERQNPTGDELKHWVVKCSSTTRTISTVGGQKERSNNQKLATLLPGYSCDQKRSGPKTSATTQLHIFLATLILQLSSKRAGKNCRPTWWRDTSFYFFRDPKEFPLRLCPAFFRCCLPGKASSNKKADGQW